MRLIDNDEVIKIVREEVKDEDNTLPVQFRAGVDYVLKIIDELSTVEAIPIEFIKQLIEEFDCERGNAIKDTFAHILTGLLEFWEFEQEKENE